MRKPSVRKTTLLLLLLVIGGIGLRAWLLHHILQAPEDHQGILMMRYIYYPTYSRLDGLVMGVSLAVIRTFRAPLWVRITRHGNVLCLLGLASIACGIRLCDFDYPSPDLPASILFAFPLLAFGFSLLVASALSATGAMRRKVPGATTAATLAYSLYLTHKSVAHATHQLLPHVTADAGWQSLMIYAMACLAIASLLYLYVERPFLELRIRRETRRTTRQLHCEPSDPAAGAPALTARRV